VTMFPTFRQFYEAVHGDRSPFQALDNLIINSEFWLQPTQRGRVQVTADDEAAAIQEAEQSAIHPHYTGATREGSASLAPLKSWLS